MKRILILIVFVVIVSVGGYIIYKEGTLSPNKSDHTAKIFIINRGDGLTTIAKNLLSAGLIRNRVAFYLVVKELGIEKKIEAGDYRLNPSMDAYQVATNLTHGTLDVWVTIIEGLRKEEIAQVIAQNFEIPEAEFINQAKEGYLFPDTYLIPRQATAEAIIQIFNHNFDKKFDTERQAKAQKIGMTRDDVVTLSSIVEREARTPAVRQQVASVLLKRLHLNMPLQSDTTIQYALGYQPDEKTWWKKDITFVDLEIDSPFNTYKHTGLPPGPICNPSISSVDAVLNADPNIPYLFYLVDGKGRIHFARTAAEHQENINKYLK